VYRQYKVHVVENSNARNARVLVYTRWLEDTRRMTGLTACDGTDLTD